MSQQPKSSDDENQTEMYIRVKRNKTTYFLQCLPSEKVLQIKEKLQVLIDEPVNNQRLILIQTGEVLDDSKSLADQKVENDAAVALTLRKGSVPFLFSLQSHFLITLL
ncbi:OLC1v1035448C4 [Oldenlandia corymbosa var. corymbosa]|uniref:OLC1v1035448C4 n=2 Tax=Oldenlandia corymbosa var. corymbosa TaxID=529605 RepID=A0AAV1CUC8_OLDCO|nr:OLC1v1035448C4 [Oldenlandia corymbosa var. corymbosa]